MSARELPCLTLKATCRKSFGASAISAKCLTSSTQLELLLEKIIRKNLPKMSNSLAESMLEYPGPLSSFAAKTDMARAFGELQDWVAHDLGVIRKVWNEFAHAERETTFESQSIKDIVKNHRKFKKGFDHYEYFVQKVPVRAGVTEGT